MRLTRRAALQLGAAAAAAQLVPKAARAQAMVATPATAVLTRGGDNDRTYCYQDTTLTVASVMQRGMRRYCSLPMEGDARGAEAQALVVPGVTGADGVKRDVVVLCSMNNLVYAYDYSSDVDFSAILWATKLGTPIQVTQAIDMHMINDHAGIYSTPVVDPDTQTLYVVTWQSLDGTAANGQHYIHALSVATGQHVQPPVPLAGVHNGGQAWSADMRKQRSSLALVTINGCKTVFFCAGTVLESSSSSAGWVIAYDVISNTLAAALPLSQSLGAGCWMAGGAPAIDDNGDLLLVTGNGSFNPAAGDWGESILRVRYTPSKLVNATDGVKDHIGQRTYIEGYRQLSESTGASAATLAVVDWWTPYTDAGRAGEDPTLSTPHTKMAAHKLAGVSQPTESARAMRMPVNGMAERTVTAHEAGSPLYSTKPTAIGSDYLDEDLGSGPVNMIKRYRRLVVSGKDGIAYVCNMDALGKTMPADFANAAANYAKLSVPPFWYSYFPAPNTPSAAPQDPSTLDFMWGDVTHHIHSPSPQVFTETHGQMLACWGENGQARVWTMAPSGALTFLASSDETASVQATGPGGGMPGGFITISTNQGKPGTTLLHAIIPYGDGNATVTWGRYLIYDLETYDTRADGSKKLRVLWDTQAADLAISSTDLTYAFLFPKFNEPVISGGRVILPRYDGTMDVLGLA